MLNRCVPFVLLFAFASSALWASEPIVFNTTWIPTKPEVLTYRSTSPQGDGLFQVTLFREANSIVSYLNIITPGYMKTIAATWDAQGWPVRSSARIMVGGQVDLRTECLYDADSLQISTHISPYGQTNGARLPNTERVLDFSQIPVIPRLLTLQPGISVRLPSINPQTNTLVPFTATVEGRDSVNGVQCVKVMVEDFEGKAVYWVEAEGQRRVIRIEQPTTKRVTELIR